MPVHGTSGIGAVVSMSYHGMEISISHTLTLPNRGRRLILYRPLNSHVMVYVHQISCRGEGKVMKEILFC